jgi:hypothetical protein
MPPPRHYVVFEGLNANDHSDYTLEATGEIDMHQGMVGGVEVSRDSDAPARGSTQSGTVYAGADGYLVYGAIKSIDVENPEHVQMHMGRISDPDPDADECEVTVRAESVEFVSGQGPGEGAFELTIQHDMHGGQTETDRLRLPTGSEQDLSTSIESFSVTEGRSLEKLLTTKVTEREVPSDWFTGNDDYGDSTMDLTLTCGQPIGVSNEVTIGSDRGNEGKVRVWYTIDKL